MRGWPSGWRAGFEHKVPSVNNLPISTNSGPASGGVDRGRVRPPDVGRSTALRRRVAEEIFRHRRRLPKKPRRGRSERAALMKIAAFAADRPPALTQGRSLGCDRLTRRSWQQAPESAWSKCALRVRVRDAGKATRTGAGSSRGFVSPTRCIKAWRLRSCKAI